MAFEQNDMTGAIFKNERKTSDNHPNMTGSCKINGKFYWISAWTKTSKTGMKYQSLAFTEKEGDGGASPNPSEDFDDDIPF